MKPWQFADIMVIRIFLSHSLAMSDGLKFKERLRSIGPIRLKASLILLRESFKSGSEVQLIL
jgi:hypothetical protein